MSNDDIKQAAQQTTRRRFIGGLAAAGAVPTVLAQGKRDTKYDAIVIGGGFAGVTASRDLSWRGKRTLLLEARPRLGGRTWTAEFSGHDIDIGGTWIGWSQPHVWAEVMRYSIPIVESAAASASQAIWMNQGKAVVGTMDAYAETFEAVANKFFAPARGILPRPFDPLYVDDVDGLDALSAAEVIEGLDLTEQERNLIMTFAAMNGHSYPDQSSYLDQLRWFSLGNFNLWNMWDNLGRYRIKGGTRQLLNRIQKDNGSEVKHSTPVRSVVQSQDGVVVTAVDGATYEARKVIVALPLNCLVDIEFTPNISDTKRRVSEARHTGSGTKVYARTSKKHPVFMGHGNYDMPLCFLFTEYDDAASQLLVGFGIDPDRIDIHDQQAIAAAMRQFIPDLELEETLSYDWNSDPYARGTWCMYRPNTLTNDLPELQRAEGNIYFAGADIASGWRGFIDGAIESGSRTARQVADHLG
jgi:monoamine oxidase